jgi:hypothetical protein
MPVEDEAVAKGNVRVDLEFSPPIAHVLAGTRLDDARAQGEPLHVSHFVNCPRSKQFRKRT